MNEKSLLIKKIPPRERLIFALDVPTVTEARQLVEKLDESVLFYKLGLQLFMAGGYYELIAWLQQRGVTLISAGLDEVPGVYKDIHQVMAAQEDLVEVIGQFDPKLVKMAPHGERAED